MALEILDPAIELMGDFIDAEENRWWIRPLKSLMYVTVFSITPLYFYFT